MSVDRRPHLKLWCNATPADVNWRRTGSPLGVNRGQARKLGMSRLFGHSLMPWIRAITI